MNQWISGTSTFPANVSPGFSLGRLHMGGGGASAGRQSVNGGGTHEGDIDLLGRGT